jgi:hypothetical protein
MKAAVADFDKFLGSEFDWFALDDAGVIGLFSTAGFGEIPVEVMWHEAAHRAIAEQLPVPNYGSSGIWQDYGRQGLFAFDWQHWNGPYLKVAAPSAVMKAEVRSQILTIPNLPRLDLRFGLVQRVSIPRFES